jgi:predicted enzyme related to lactoylglutathione lyase
MDTIPNFRIKQLSPQLMVTDLGPSIEFFTRMLGFAVEFLYEDFYAGIVKNGFSIHLKVGQVSNKIDEQLDITFAVEDIDQLYKALSDQGITIVQSLRDMPYGKEFYISDPDGNILAFLAAS